MSKGEAALTPRLTSSNTTFSAIKGQSESMNNLCDSHFICFSEAQIVFVLVLSSAAAGQFKIRKITGLVSSRQSSRRAL